MRVNFFSQSGTQNTGPSQGLSATLTGPLILAGNPTSPLEAAPKQYVDSAINSLNAANIKTGTLSAARLPAFTGDAASATGSGSFILANTGVAAGTYTKVTVDSKGRVVAGSNITNDDIPPFDWSKITSGKPTTVEGYGITDALKVGGATITGTLSFNLDPTSDMHAATKQYVDSLSGNGSIILPGTVTRRPVSTTPAGFLRANGGLVSKTTYSALFAIIKDSYIVKNNVDYTNYAALGAGTPWSQQYDINPNITPATLTWTVSGTQFPASVYAASVFVTKNRVYVVGGADGNTISANVYTAPIDSNGTVGTWSATTAIPVALAASTVVVTKNRVYLLGGSNSSGLQRLTYSAVINSDGTIGTWTAGPLFPDEIANGRAIVTKSHAYVIGAQMNDSAGRSVYISAVGSDGTLGAWSVGAYLPSNLQMAQVAVIKNKVYVFGGRENQISSSKMYVATISTNGTLGTWSAVSNIPAVYDFMQLYVTKNRIYLVGGYSTGAASSTNTCYSAPINTDGTIGQWVLAGDLPDYLARGVLFSTSSKLYHLGGLRSTSSSTVVVSAAYEVALSGVTNDYSPFYDGTINKFDGSNISGDVVVANNYIEFNESQPGNGRPWQQQSQINKTNTGSDITGWASFTTNICQTNLLVTKSYVYTLGGNNGNGGITNVIWRAPINSNGTLGTWTNTGVPFPTSAFQGSIFVVYNRVYVFGAEVNTAVGYTNTIDPVTGEIGSTWTQVTGPSTGMRYSTALVISNRVYMFVAGGVYTAIANNNGLGAWTYVDGTPNALYNVNAFVAKNKVYVIGSFDGASTTYSGGYVATIQSNGTLSAFTPTTTFPTGIGGSSVVVTGSAVYIFGGVTPSGISSDVYSAAINSDGSLGSWTKRTALPSGLRHAHAVVTSSRIYLIGGLTTMNTGMASYSASFAGGLNDYSQYIDGTFTYSSVGTFALPDMSSAESASEYYFVKT